MDAAVTTLPTRPRVYLLDTHGLIFQMFHGIPQMNAPDGRPTNAVFGVTRALMDLYDRGAEYLIATFDAPEPTFREVLYKEYKAHRPPPPDDLILQLSMIDQVLDACRIPIVKQPGYEADDVMATLAVSAVERGFDVYLCSSDKDCRQLLSPHIRIQNLRKGETLDAEGLMADWGIRPDQVIDYQTLVGDSVDNIPGLAGCGAKTAAKWLKEYDTLENLIRHADFVGGPKLKQALKAAIADGSLTTSRTLVTLRTDVPMTIDWDSWKRRDWDGPRLLELFQEFGFRGFANKVRATLSASGAKKNEEMLQTAGIIAAAPAHRPATETRVAASAQGPAFVAPLTTAPGSIFDDGPEAAAAHDATTQDASASGGEPVPVFKPKPSQPSLFDVLDGAAAFEEAPPAPPLPPDNWKGDYRLIDTQAAFDEFLAQLRQQPRFAFDLETTSLKPLLADIVGYAFCWKAEEAYYVPVRGLPDARVLDPATTLAALKPILQDPAIAKVNQNIKYDRLVLRAQGVELAGVDGDSMVAHYLLHSGERSHNLDDLTLHAFGHRNIPIEDLIGKGKKQITMDRVPTEKAAAYACEDADAAWRLAEKYEPELAPAGLRRLYDELEVPLIEVLAELEYNGVLLDLPLLKRLSGEMAEQLATMEAGIHKAAGKEFNVASPKQLREILFTEMKLKVQKRTGTTGEASTDQETLERLAAEGHELPRRIVDYRQVAKLKGTYVDALPALVNPRTGRVHTSFNQTVATTGRLSSSEPNLQNIPTRSEQGRQIRQAFVAPPGWTLLSADYSQVELRLLAHFCQDERLQSAFAEDRDIHARVAAEIFAVPESAVTSDQRRVAKTVNFGVLYGMSPIGLAIRLGTTRKSAAKFIDDYFARYPAVLRYQDTLLANARKSGKVATLLGRVRHFNSTAIRPGSTYQQRNQAEREAINMEIQGSAADLIKVAMLNIHRRLRRDNWRAKMVLSVHDELVFEAPNDEVVGLAKLVREEMTGAMALGVPLRVDVSAGLNWLDGEDVE